jgi:hypothetical protein
MKTLKLTPIAFTLFLLFNHGPAAEAGNYCPPAHPPTAYINPDTRNANLKGPVHPSAVDALKCVVNGLQKAGLPIKTLWGYGCRPLSNSNHPRGLAVDVDQYARDRTSPPVPRQQGVDIARSCNVTSGAVLRNPENGHFEVRSMSRGAQARAAPVKRATQRRTVQTRARQRYQNWFWYW